MEQELIEPFYMDLRRLLNKYKLKTIVGFTIDDNDHPDVIASTFNIEKDLLMKMAHKVADLFKDEFDIDNTTTGFIQGDY